MNPLAADVCTGPDPAEPELPGLEPAPAPGLANFAILGRLVRSARVWTPDERTVQVELLVRQADPAHPHALNVVARCSFPAEQLLEVQASARHLAAGAEVLVSGKGLDHYASRTHGPVLRLLHVDHYAAVDHKPLTPITPHHGAQPHAQHAAAA